MGLDNRVGIECSYATTVCGRRICHPVLAGLTPLGRMVYRLRMCTWYPLSWFSWLTILATNSWSAIRRFSSCLVDLHGSSPCTAWDTFSSAAVAFSFLDFIFFRLHAVPCPGSTATERGPPTDCTSIQPTLRWPCLLGTIQAAFSSIKPQRSNLFRFFRG